MPILAVDIVDRGRRRPGQQGRQHQTDALARARRCKTHHMFWTVMTEIVVANAAEENALGPEQASANDLPWRRPTRRAVGRDQLILARAPDGIGHRKQCARNASTCSDSTGALEDLGRIRLVRIPPLKQPPWQIDRIAREREPGRAKAILIAQRAGRPLRRAPGRGDDNAEDNGDLANIDLCWKHSLPHSQTPRERRDEDGENDAHSIEIKFARDNELYVDPAYREGIMRDPTSA